MLRVMTHMEIMAFSMRMEKARREMPQHVLDAMTIVGHWIDEPETWFATVERREAADHHIHRCVRWDKPIGEEELARREERARSRYTSYTHARPDITPPSHFPTWEAASDAFRKAWIEETR